jgi:hypothetical protein
MVRECLSLTGHGSPRADGFVHGQADICPERRSPKLADALIGTRRQSLTSFLRKEVPMVLPGVNWDHVALWISFRLDLVSP